MSFYDYTVQDNKGQEVSLADYKGKVVLVVNTATGCGFTPQYEGLEKLYQQYGSEGFVVLDFPCNQFGHQAPGSDEEIHAFCTAKYATSFPRFKKIDVNGANESPVYTWLKKQKGGLLGGAIKWNFTKFLLDREGNVVERYAPTVAPADIEEKIKSLL